ASLIGYTPRTGIGRPSSFTATIVRNDSVVRRSVPWTMSCAVTLTYTSIELVPVYVTNASRGNESPTLADERKSTESIEAVTTELLACFIDVKAAISSIYAN